jgi:hypothetical protein
MKLFLDFLSISRFVIVIFFTFQLTSTKGAIWGMPTLIDLVYNSIDVVEGELIYFEKDSAVFSLRSIYNTEKTYLLSILNFSGDFHVRYIFDQDNLWVRERPENISIQDGEKFILFLQEDYSSKIVASLSSAFYLHRNKIYYPIQLMNPDELTILPLETTITWDQLKINLIDSKLRVASLRKILQNEHSKENNQRLFQWIENEKSELLDRNCRLPKNCGWGHLGGLVFQRIINSGIWIDAWKASSLYNKMFGFYLSDQDNKYSNENARNYFEKIAFETDLDKEGKLIALWYFSESMWYPDILETKNSIPPKLKRNILKTIEKLKPLFSEFEFQRHILGSLGGLFYSENDELRELANTFVLPFLIHEYLKPANEFVRNEIGDILKRQLTEAKLNEITGNDHGILADIIQISGDTHSKRLVLAINVDIGYAKIVSIPTASFINISKERQHSLRLELPNFKIPYANGEGSRYFYFDLKDFTPGHWKVQIEGRAGEEDQYKWKTNFSHFEIK